MEKFLQAFSRFSGQRLVTKELAIQWKRADGAAFGDHLRHGDPGIRGEVYHRGSGGIGNEDIPEGEDPHEPASVKAVEEAFKFCLH